MCSTVHLSCGATFSDANGEKETIIFLCPADHEQDWLPFPGDPYSAERADYKHIDIYCGPYGVTILWRIQLNPMKSFVITTADAPTI